MVFRSSVLLALLVAQPLVNEDVLEPSVENEVAHALARASDGKAAESPSRELKPPTSAEVEFARLYTTNGLTTTAKAIALVSSQRTDGRWRVGTNDVTRAAVWVLNRLIGAETHETTFPQ